MIVSRKQLVTCQHVCECIFCAAVSSEAATLRTQFRVKLRAQSELRAESASYCWPNPRRAQFRSVDHVASGGLLFSSYSAIRKSPKGSAFFVEPERIFGGETHVII